MTTLDVSETRPGSSTPSRPLDAGAFAPGTMLADRYRIVALAGRGGMGEVYRAEDLRLGQTVALKFLPASLERDLVARERLLAEVRNARNVSHPNVCRVYDVGEVQGRTFLTMEYIDGEDLASLLRRIGRLPADKVAEVARQLCAGLAAAHDRGVLHRDLKPANVMIDGRGHARITDFGLAVEAGASTSAPEFAGTAAYMAPERFKSAPATVQSDLYSLGLIVYEACTGRSPFRATTLGEWQRVHTDSTPASPSSLVSVVEPAVERAIMRCLEKDPGRRPASAAQVASALPGGDPLAAAVAAGETPSPELVAACGEEGTLPRSHAWWWLAACLVALAVSIVALSSWTVESQLSLPHPELQKERARQVLRLLGYSGPVADEAWWVRQNKEYLEHYRDLADGGRTLQTAMTSPEALLFCYRQGPSFLASTSGNVSPDEPAPVLADDAYLELGTDGRLLLLRVVPPAREPSPRRDRTVDWSPLLALSGLRLDQLTPVEPGWGPVFAFDERAAWEGVRDNERVRVEVAAFDRRPTYLRVAPTWMASPAPPDVPAWSLFSWIVTFLYLGGLAFLAALAWRNVRLGRGDRRSALRLSGLVFVIDLLAGVLSRHWTAAPGGPGTIGGGTIGPMAQVVGTLAGPLFLAAATWLAYVGLEPFVRRQFPHLLITSTRLLDGRWRDPLVGRSVLTGVLAAIVMVLFMRTLFASWRMLGWAVVAPGYTPGPPVATLVLFAAYVAGTTAVYLWTALLYVGVLLLARWVLRGHAAAWFGLGAIFFFMYAAWSRVFIGPSPLLFVTSGLVIAATSTVVLWRSGVLALATWLIVMLLLRDTPWTLALTRWSAGPTWLATALIVGLTLWGFMNILGRQSAFPAGTMDT